MLKEFSIFNPLIGEEVALLVFDYATQKFKLTIDRQYGFDDLPLSLGVHTMMNHYELNSDQSMDWVRARICPPNRHNISSILRDNDLAEYSEIDLITLTMGHSDKDWLYLRARSACEAQGG